MNSETLEPGKVSVVEVALPESGVRSHMTALVVLAAVAKFDPDAAVEHREVICGFVSAVIAGAAVAKYLNRVQVGGVLSLSFGGIQIEADSEAAITVAASCSESSASRSRPYPTGWVQVQQATPRGPWKWQTIMWGVNVYEADAPVEIVLQADDVTDLAVRS